MVNIEAKELNGNDVYLDFPSVGATENIMLAGVLAKGETTISNCAIEPEIVDLAKFLNSIGAKISGAGTDTIVIKGVNELGGCCHRVIPDRIEAGTFMIAVAGTGGNVKIQDVIPEQLRPVISKLKEADVEVKEDENSVTVCSDGFIANTDIKTMPYPGFPTDMQAQFMGLMCGGLGTGIINETVFENRFMQVPEFIKMGADITIEGRCAVVKGVETMKGAKVSANSIVLISVFAINPSEHTVTEFSSSLTSTSASFSFEITGLSCSGITSCIFTLPPVPATAIIKVPASILSGITL